jgi:putative hydrolase of the HAD superfamily
VSPEATETPQPPQLVSFDCWSTLIFEPDLRSAHARRIEALRASAARAGIDVSPDAARAALDAAWRRHIELWQRHVSSGSEEIASWALEELGAGQPELAQQLGIEFAEVSLGSEVVALDGARETLQRLAAAGVRRALVCDTGFSPGRVVRRLLDRQGLLELLEVCVFSDEVGVPKPDSRVFQAALEPLETAPEDAVHVGDLRRTDVAGGRAAGMRTVRIRWHHDDLSELPDGVGVAGSHTHLLELLGF